MLRVKVIPHNVVLYLDIETRDMSRIAADQTMVAQLQLLIYLIYVLEQVFSFQD